VHRGGRSPEGRQISATAPRQPVAQDPIDQADGGWQRQSNERNATAVRGYAPPLQPQPAADEHDDDDAATSTAATRCQNRDR